MSVYKLFKCNVFNPDVSCNFNCSGEENTVIENAVNHEVTEHGYEDSPQLREDIRKSLIDEG